MNCITSDAPIARVRDATRQKLSRLGLAGLLATIALTVAPAAHARITQIQILNRAVAFGGYSFPGVGQYTHHKPAGDHAAL